MNIDERLEALTQSVELLSSMQKSASERHEALAHTVELLTRDVNSIQSFVKDIAESTSRLLHLRRFTNTEFRSWNKSD